MSFQSSPTGILSVSSVVLALTFIFVVLRFVVRKNNKVPWKLDDWILVLALILVETMAVLAITSVSLKCFGYSKKAPTSTPANNELFYKLLLSYQLIQTLSLGFIKAGALFFYRRVFCTGTRTDAFNILTGILLVAVVLWTGVFFLLDLFECGRRIDANWEGPKAYVKYCGLALPFVESVSITDFVLDVLIILIPIPQIYNLHTTLARRVAISLAFGLGVMGTIASCIRMAKFVELVNATMKVKLTTDPRISDTQGIYWSMLESGLTLIAVNLPSTWSLVAKITPESILRSLRSLISGRSNTITSNSATSRPVKFPSTSSETHIVGKEAEVYELSGRGDVEAQRGSGRVRNG